MRAISIFIGIIILIAYYKLVLLNDEYFTSVEQYYIGVLVGCLAGTFIIPALIA